MTAIIMSGSAETETIKPQSQTVTSISDETRYPSSDGTPIAETYLHIEVITTLFLILRQYLGDRALVLANQFFYYHQDFSKMRVAPDVMIIFGIKTEPRDKYKLWEEKAIPSVIFEITSLGTKNQDQETKKNLYEQIGVTEYWLFDPKGEWISDQLIGYRLDSNQEYRPITNYESTVLGLCLQVDQNLISFYRLDNQEKLLNLDELSAKTTQLEAENTQLENLLARYRQQFGDLPQ